MNKEAALCGKAVVEKLWSIHNAFLEDLRQSIRFSSDSSGQVLQEISCTISQSFSTLLVPDLQVCGLFFVFFLLLLLPLPTYW